MAKVHLFLSSQPLRAGQNVAAKCGDLVEKAEILCKWDETPTGTKIEWPTIGICSRCIQAAEKKHKERFVFVYAVKSRTEERKDGTEI